MRVILRSSDGRLVEVRFNGPAHNAIYRSSYFRSNIEYSKLSWKSVFDRYQSRPMTAVQLATKVTALTAPIRRSGRMRADRPNSDHGTAAAQ